jgi:dTDP-4-dehydrorhamnose reductase
MARILIFGERGQMATALARAYAARRDMVRCVGRAAADIADRAAVDVAVSAFSPELIVNAAAYTAVDKAEDEEREAFLVNRDGAAHIAEAAHKAGAPLVHISTDYVFDGTKATPYVETDAPNPVSAYGRSKLAGEVAVSAALPDHVILRTSWVCGPDGSNFVKTMLRLAGQRPEIGVVDDQWGSPTFAADLAQAIARIGEALLGTPDRAPLAGVYHASGTGETTWCRFARAIMAGAEKHGLPCCRVKAITTAEYPTRARRPANSRLDCGELARVFGLHLPDWQASLDICLAQLAATRPETAA